MMMVLHASPLLFSSIRGQLWSKAIEFAVIWNCFLLSSISRDASDDSRAKGEGNMDKQNRGGGGGIV